MSHRTKVDTRKDLNSFLDDCIARGDVTGAQSAKAALESLDLLEETEPRGQAIKKEDRAPVKLEHGCSLPSLVGILV